MDLDESKLHQYDVYYRHSEAYSPPLYKPSQFCFTTEIKAETMGRAFGIPGSFIKSARAMIADKFLNQKLDTEDVYF